MALLSQKKLCLESLISHLSIVHETVILPDLIQTHIHAFIVVSNF